MKLRLQKNAIRYRLRKSDLEQLKQEGFVKEAVEFPGTSLTYELRIADIAVLKAQYLNDYITVNIPSVMARNWISTDEVGIYLRLLLANDRVLDIAIEKDFPCKDRPEENKSDTFTELSGKNRGNIVC